VKRLLLAAFILALASNPAAAAETPPPPALHVVDMAAVLRGIDGKPIKDAFQQTAADQACEKCDDLTLAAAVTRVLLIRTKDDANMDPLQSWALQDLARRVNAPGPVTLNARERAVIVERLLKVYGGLNMQSIVLGAAIPLVDPERRVPELK